jgi:hypothetical protein
MAIVLIAALDRVAAALGRAWPGTSKKPRSRRETWRVSTNPAVRTKEDNVTTRRGRHEALQRDPEMPTSASAASSGGDVLLTFTTSSVQAIRRRRDQRPRSSLSVVLAASIVPLLVIAMLAVATQLT